MSIQIESTRRAKRQKIANDVSKSFNKPWYKSFGIAKSSNHSNSKISKKSSNDSLQSFRSINTPFFNNRQEKSLLNRELSLSSSEISSKSNRSSSLEKRSVSSDIPSENINDFEDIQHALKEQENKNMELLSEINHLHEIARHSSNKLESLKKSFDRFNHSNDIFCKKNSPKILNPENRINNKSLNIGDKKISLKKKYEKNLLIMEQEIKSHYRNQMEIHLEKYRDKQNENIEKINKRLNKKINKSQETVLKLKKQNENLKEILAEMQRKCAKYEQTNSKISEEQVNIQNRKYNELFKLYMNLQKDYIKLKSSQCVLCKNCKN